MKLQRPEMLANAPPPRKPKVAPTPVEPISKAAPTPAEPLAKLAPIISAAGKPVPFLEVKRFHCRAVLDERGEDGLALFCGARKRKGSSWCPKHHRLFIAYGRA